MFNKVATKKKILNSKTTVMIVLLLTSVVNSFKKEYFNKEYTICKIKQSDWLSGEQYIQYNEDIERVKQKKLSSWY